MKIWMWKRKNEELTEIDVIAYIVFAVAYISNLLYNHKELSVFGNI